MDKEQTDARSMWPSEAGEAASTAIAALDRAGYENPFEVMRELVDYIETAGLPE